MTADDARLIAQLVAGKRVHCVSDEAVMALARRVLELESDAEEHAAYVRAVEREACAKLVEQWVGGILAGVNCAAAIRARGGK